MYTYKQSFHNYVFDFSSSVWFSGILFMKKNAGMVTKASPIVVGIKLILFPDGSKDSWKIR